MVIVKDEKEFNKEIEKGKVLVDFYADWCGPCKMLGEILKEVDKDKVIKIVKVNVDEFEDLARVYNVITIPKLLVMEDKEVINEHSGLMTKEELLNFIGNDK